MIDSLSQNKNLQSTSDFFKTSFGNIIEWYDFSLYGIFAVAISHAFFPNYSQFMALIMTFLTFSVSFAARPIGSLIFGFIGDKFGAHYSVNLSVWCMAIPTVMIGFLPAYEQVGYIAPIMLIIFRFLQGISAGGQFSGLITIAAENPVGKRSYFVGLILSISMIGSLLASFCGLISYALFGSLSMSSLVWRIPFILSGILFATYIKIKPEFEKIENNSNYKLKDIFKKQPLEMLYMTSLAAVLGSIYYIIFSYSVTFLEVHAHASGAKPLVAINCLLLISLVGYPLLGKLADKSLDRISVAKRATLLFAGATILLSLSLDFGWIVSCFILMALFNCVISTYISSMYAEVFNEEYRMTACSLCYSGGAVVGGLSPAIAELATRSSLSGFYMLVLALAFILYLVLEKIAQTEGYKTYIKIPQQNFLSTINIDEIVTELK